MNSLETLLRHFSKCHHLMLDVEVPMDSEGIRQSNLFYRNTSPAFADLSPSGQRKYVCAHGSETKTELAHSKCEMPLKSLFLSYKFMCILHFIPECISVRCSIKMF